MTAEDMFPRKLVVSISLAAGLVISFVSVGSHSEPVPVSDEQQASIKLLMSKSRQHLRCSEWARVGKDSNELAPGSASLKHLVSGASAIRDAWELGLGQHMRAAAPEVFDQAGMSVGWIIGYGQAKAEMVAERMAEEGCAMTVLAGELGSSMKCIEIKLRFSRGLRNISSRHLSPLHPIHLTAKFAIMRG